MVDTNLKSRAKKLRSNQTDAEIKLWSQLRARRFENRKFYHQFVIDNYIVDFVQRELKLIVELDGGQHSQTKEKDDNRTNYLEKKGYQVIRFWNNEVIQNFEGVLNALSLALSQRERGLKPEQMERGLKPEIIPTVNPVYAKRRAYRGDSKYSHIWQLLDGVYDPELPGLTIWDLGILQDVELIDDEWQIDITPTYSGCPAVETINQDIRTVMKNAGYDKVKVNVVLSPAWSTEMMSPVGKAHLKSIHIAPPDESDRVSCPVCESDNTQVVSQFGSTACKALYQCKDCFEHFDYFKHF